MKRIFLFIFFIPTLIFAQKKGDNTIIIKGVTFKEVVYQLLDKGFSIDKIDSNYMTIKTDFKEGTGKNKWMKYRLMVIGKDSVIFLTGEWYNTMLIGHKIAGQEQTIDNNIDKIEYTNGNPKNCFIEMSVFAQSFNKPVEYFKR